MELRTHKSINTALCGKVVDLKKDYAKVVLKTTQIMAADEKGLVHGGFTFGAADYAAMAAVNEPNVVLVAADVGFKAPIQVGDEVVFEARVIKEEGKKVFLTVIGNVGEQRVFNGVFTAFVPDTHVLFLL
ncbi:hotdog domain-containing protein [Nitratiruptor sp. SB155-2]|uniref:hotdog domain-containing protein n=1 Tax=Nitratiruptor sp. (strain SB155-2) TaxID=387092 RepID=UPI0001587354|nr:hotdog domain-containing protein [Nitratiruptor sp. SB155-2]BAF70157.1 conserved hypothetical protein [Nitratiruptor sp. SB155-2]